LRGDSIAVCTHTECHQYAEYLQSVKKEPCKAAELFHTTCKEMGFTESCLALGNMHLSGVGESVHQISHISNGVSKTFFDNHAKLLIFQTE